MRYFIREWHDQTATLITEDGYALDRFASVDDAVDACIEECLVMPEFIESHSNYLGRMPQDFESSFISETGQDRSDHSNSI